MATRIQNLMKSLTVSFKIYHLLEQDPQVYKEHERINNKRNKVPSQPVLTILMHSPHCKVKI